MSSNFPILTIHMSTGGRFQIELRPDKAPNAVSGMLELVEQKAYDNLVVQRIAPDFVFQPWYDEERMGPEFQYLMDGEFDKAGFHNDLPFHKYTAGLGGDGEKTSSCGCFFIAISESCSRLDGKFTSFGTVISGFDEIERIINVPLKDIESGMEGVVVKEPVTPEIISTVTVEYNGYVPQPIKKYLP